MVSFYRWRTSILVFCFLGIGFLEAVFLTLLAKVALIAVGESGQGIQVPYIGELSISLIFFLLFAVVALKFLAGMANAWAGATLESDLTCRMRLEILRTYSEASWQMQTSFDKGGLQQLLITIPNVLSGQLLNLLLTGGNLIALLAMLSVAFVADPFLTIGLVAIVGALTFVFNPLRRKIKAFSTIGLEQQRVISARVVEMSDLSLEIKSFGVSEESKDQVKSAIFADRTASVRAGLLRQAVTPIYNSVVYGAVTLGLILLVSSGTDLAGSTGPVLLVMLRSLSYGQGIQNAAVGLASIAPNLEYLERQNREFLQSREGNRGTKGPDWGAIRVTRLEYRYPGSQELALKGVDFELQAGEMLGLVGPSGSGKSTLVRLLLGVLSPTDGVITVNGQSLEDIDRQAWANFLGYVPQKPGLFHGSVRENVLFFRSSYSDDEIWASLALADLDSEVGRMSQRLETSLGGSGRTLSGGEAQRLCIARALVGQKRFLIMDEPSSSIDSISEGKIASTLLGLKGQSSAIVVSHRLGILEACDRLLVLEDGQSTFRGTVEEAMHYSEYFKKVIRSSAE